MMRNGRDRRSENPFLGHAKKERVVVFGTDQRITSGPAAKRLHSKAEYMTAPERFADSQIALAPRAVAVGTEIALRPPHRSRRALLTHRAPTLDSDEEPLLRPRMQDAGEWQVPVSDRLHSGPRQSAPLAAAHEGAVPAFDHVMPEC
jgi:hypothetical protein